MDHEESTVTLISSFFVFHWQRTSSTVVWVKCFVPSCVNSSDVSGSETSLASRQVRWPIDTATTTSKCHIFLRKTNLYQAAVAMTIGANSAFVNTTTYMSCLMLTSRITADRASDNTTLNLEPRILGLFGQRVFVTSPRTVRDCSALGSKLYWARSKQNGIYNDKKEKKIYCPKGKGTNGTLREKRDARWPL